MRITVLKVGTPSTTVLMNDGSTVADLISSLEGHADYEGTFQKFLNGVQITTAGEDGTIAQTAALTEGDVFTLSPKTVGGK